MRTYFFFLFSAFAMLPGLLSACGGCMTLYMREASILELAGNSNIFSAKVIDIEIVKRPEYEEKAKSALEHLFGYGSMKSEIPDFDSYLTLEIIEKYKGNVGKSIKVKVKPDFETNYCNYFKYKKNESYIFLLNDELETYYYSLVYLLNPKDFNKENIGRTDMKFALNIHKKLIEDLNTIASANGLHRKFYNSQGHFYAQGTLVNGVPEGLWTSYHAAAEKNAKKYESGSYKNGLKTGTWLQYNYDSEVVSGKTVYENNERDGRVQTYRNGFIIYDLNHKAGRQDGKQIYYHYQSDVISNIYNYSDGQPDGDFLSYDIEGKLIGKQTYVKGEAIKV